MVKNRSVRQADQFMEALEQRKMLAGDHPSLADFPDSTVMTLTYLHSDAWVDQEFGELEVEGDDDLFSFVAPYSGRTAFTVASLTGEGLAPAIQLFDDTGSPLTSWFDHSGSGAAAVFPIPYTNIVQGEEYFINISAGTPSVSYPNVTGGYMLFILMEIPPLPSEAGPQREIFNGLADGGISTGLMGGEGVVNNVYEAGNGPPESHEAPYGGFGTKSVRVIPSTFGKTVDSTFGATTLTWGNPDAEREFDLATTTPSRSFEVGGTRTFERARGLFADVEVGGWVEPG